MATVFPSQGAEMSFEHERYPIYTQDDSLDDVIKDQQRILDAALKVRSMQVIQGALMNMGQNFDPIVRRRHRHYRRALGLTVADGQLVTVHFAHHSFHHFHGAGGTRHHPGAQAGQIVVLELRQAQFRDKHGRHAIQRSHTFRLHRLERRARIECPIRKNNRCPARQRRHGTSHAAEAVIHG
jgi:hypothetical protein